MYIATQGSLSGGKSVTFHILDWNMNPTIYTYTDTGYNNNMYKLAVMLFSMDSELFQRLYLDGEDALIQRKKLMELRLVCLLHRRAMRRHTGLCLHFFRPMWMDV